MAGVAGRYNLGLATDETGGEKKAKCGSKKVVFVGQPWLLPPSECSLVVPTPPRNRSMSSLTHKFSQTSSGFLSERSVPSSYVLGDPAVASGRADQASGGGRTEAQPGPGLARLNYSCISEQVLSSFSCSERRIN